MSRLPLTQSLKIAYFGLPLGALALARAGFVPRVISLGHTDQPGARRVRRVLSKDALVLGKPDLHAPDVVHALASVKPDVILSWFWPKRIPEHVLSLAARGAFGVHPSLLPKWRGPDPYFWALRHGERETGVTLHRLAAEYDTGHLIESTRVAIEPDMNSWRLAKRMDKPSLALLVSAAKRLSAGESLAGSPQDEALVTLAPAPEPEDLVLDWTKGCDDVLRLVRAASPHPGATMELDGEVVEVLRARRSAYKMPRALLPADAVMTSEGVVIVTADGAVVLERIRLDDGVTLDGEDVADAFPELARLP